jgi:hypothetical protein
LEVVRRRCPLIFAVILNEKAMTPADPNSHELDDLLQNPPARSPPVALPSGSLGISPVEEDPIVFSGTRPLRSPWQNNSKLDGFEQLLKEKAENDAFTSNLSRDYSQFKTKPATPVFRALVQVYIIQPSLASLASLSYPLDVLQEDASFSITLDLLFDSLTSGDEQTLRFW